MKLLARFAQVAQLLLVIVACIVGMAFFGWLLGWGILGALGIIKDPKKITSFIRMANEDGEAAMDIRHDNSNWTTKQGEPT